MSNTNLPAGTSLQGGRYKILRYISSGGFGCTYEAIHVKLGKRLAIKEFFVKDFCNRDETTSHVSVGTSSKEGLVRRLSEKFCEEAQALSELNHPGIVRVIDVFDENGTSYFVMDYIDGKSLNELVNSRGPLPERVAVKFIRQVADALKYVHANNRLHLDVKPGNIMISKDGRAILIDFGASKQYDEVEGENTSTLLGKTPGYAPIEQMGNDVMTFHPSTDIYALGGTFYKLLTGKVPLSATRRVSGEELEPLPDDISEPVKRAVLQAMELNKNNRPQSIDEFLEIMDGVDSSGVDDRIIQNFINENSETILPGAVGYDSGRYSSVSQNSLQEQSVSESDEESGNTRKKIIIAAVALVAIVAVVTVFILLPDRKTPDTETETETETKPPLQEYEVTDSTILLEDGAKMIYTGMVDSIGLPKGNGHAKTEAEDYTSEYTGEFKDGKMCGKGKLIFKTTDGSRNTFDGTFKDDEFMEGTVVDNVSGEFFVGSFLNGEPYDGKFYKGKNVTNILKKGKRLR